MKILTSKVCYDSHDAAKHGWLNGDTFLDGAGNEYTCAKIEEMKKENTSYFYRFDKELEFGDLSVIYCPYIDVKYEMARNFFSDISNIGKSDMLYRAYAEKFGITYLDAIGEIAILTIIKLESDLLSIVSQGDLAIDQLNQILMAQKVASEGGTVQIQIVAPGESTRH